MSGYNRDYFVKDFADRTNINLNLIKRSDKTHYEVTQLINSLLGLVVIPHEAYYGKIGGIATAKKYSDSLRKIDNIVKECIDNGKYYCDYDGKQTAVQFIHHIRNSIAHSGNEGLLFCPIVEGGAEKITSIIFSDTDDEHRFCVELTLDQLKKLVKHIASFFEQVEAASGKNDWLDRATEYREMFKAKELHYLANEEFITHG